jgi:hypothetical protein
MLVSRSRMSDTPKMKCFVISPIGDPAGAVRAEADWVLKGLIRPALEPEFTVERADAYPKNDVITNQIILAIKNADLIVADLTGHNPNVFYELAVAHAFEKPVVPMIRSGESIPFDNHLMGTIFYSRDRIEHFEQAKADLRQAAMEAVKREHKISNPITMALGVGQMRASGDDRDQVIAELVQSVEMLKADRVSRPRLQRIPVAADLRGADPRGWGWGDPGKVEGLLLSVYGEKNWIALDKSSRQTAITNAQGAISKYEDEARSFLTREEAMDVIKREFGADNTDAITDIPF